MQCALVSECVLVQELFVYYMCLDIDDMDEKDFNLILQQRNSMAVYLKITRACGCCLYKISKEKCSTCKVGQSNWMWGGWKGKSTPEGNEVYSSADKYFQGTGDKNE